jgi:anti-sigma factor RsiW
MLGPYLDGELEASTLVQLDEHVSGCEVCGEEVRLLRAMRGSLKRVVRSAAPNELRDRMLIAMGAERVREARADADVNLLDGGSAGGFLSWRTMVPLATAAAIALMWGSATRANQPMVGESHAGFGDDLLAQLVAEHSQPLPPEAISAQAVRGLERYIGVPVHPTSFERAGAHLVGGRLMPLRPERAAMLQYVVGSGDAARRVSVFVYDAQKVQVGTANLAPRAVGTAEVRVGREKGYSVAAMQRAGVGYLLMGDLDPEETAQLAAAVYEDR